MRRILSYPAADERTEIAPACSRCGQYVCRCTAPPLILSPSLREIALDSRYSDEYVGSVIRIHVSKVSDESA